MQICHAIIGMVYWVAMPQKVTFSYDFLCDPVDRAKAMLNPCYTYQSLTCRQMGPTFGSPFHDGVCRSPLLGTNFGEPSQTRPFPKTTRIRTETQPEFVDSLLGQ